jgi:hypothetical protein
LQICHSLPVELLRRFPSEIIGIFGKKVNINMPELKLVGTDESNGTKNYEMASKTDPGRRFEIRLSGKSYTISLIKKKNG